MPASYHVSLPAFEGPFDLLLHLIAQHKVDIYDVPIADITDEYLAAVRELDAIDLDVATGFLVVAATLIELKATRLLPDTGDPDADELALEARDLLYARLLEYRTFREAAGHLRRRLDGHQAYHPREVALEPPFAGLRPEASIGVTQKEFAVLAARVFAERPPTDLDLTHVQPVRMTVAEAASMITDELTRSTGVVTFEELTAGCRHVAEVVVHFLACLELYKLDRVDLGQEDNFGALRITVTDDELPHTVGTLEMDGYDGGVTTSRIDAR